MAARVDNLARYRAKRDFLRTSEPSGTEKVKSGHRYLIQKHAASRLHYDFRLELDGTLKSWAVARGPSLDPHDRRLAVQVEDHPLAYGSFEGIIPKGQYGGGTVMLWDEGSWEPIGDPQAGLAKGHLSFLLHGKRLIGEWALVRMHTPEEKRQNWLLIKKSDDTARPGDNGKLLEENNRSVATGRNMEEIATTGNAWISSPHREKIGRGAEPGISIPKSAPTLRERGKKMPGFIEPELATLAEAMPEGEGWLHEVKFDGYRVQAHIDGGNVRLLTRRGQDWTEKFQPVPRLLSALPVDSAILDGEIVAIALNGTGNFKALQDVLSGGGQATLQYYLFDVLYLNGENLMPLPLSQRKERLYQLVTVLASDRILYSDHFTSMHGEFLQQVCRLNLEGVVSKRADSPYRSGRGHDWLKCKCHQRQEFIIGGWTPSTKGNGAVGSLLLGYYEGNALMYAGRVGTGFTNEFSLALARRLQALSRKTMPYVAVPADGRRAARWIEPRLVCEVEFTEWTPDGRLRHPSFQGLREDKMAEEIKREVPEQTPPPIGGRSGGRRNQKHAPNHAPTPTLPLRGREEIAGVRITHPERLVYPESHITKFQLAEYYFFVADHILPHVAGRPLSMVRCPEGSGEPCFFQRHVGLGKIPDLYEVPVGVKGRTENYLMIRDVEGLVSLVQWGVIEFHPWGCRADRPDQPDRIIFDFDPGPEVAWAQVVEGALEARDRLRELGLSSFTKTTGGKGLHVVVPMTRGYGWKTVKAFARVIAESMAHDSPTRYTSTISKSARTTRIFVDYLRNDLTSTAVAPFSARARPGAPVATPLAWKELTPKLDPRQFTIETIGKRLRTTADPWKEFFTIKQKIAASHLRALAIPVE